MRGVFVGVEVGVEAVADVLEGGFADVEGFGGGIGFLVSEKEVNAGGVFVWPELLVPRGGGDVHGVGGGGSGEEGDGGGGGEVAVEVGDGGV